jgi:hypothetical protein
MTVVFNGKFPDNDKIWCIWLRDLLIRHVANSNAHPPCISAIGVNSVKLDSNPDVDSSISCEIIIPILLHFLAEIRSHLKTQKLS